MMGPPRVIPCLLLKGTGLVKTRKFLDPVYVGDPINIVRILNDKEADELIILDTGAGQRGGDPPYALLRDLAGECFMPLCFGGGVRSLRQFRELIHLGVEKVSVNTAAVENPDMIGDAARLFGRQSVVVSIDVRRCADGRSTVHTMGGRQDTGLDPVVHAQEVSRRGAGEILLTCIDREGMNSGYDIDLVRAVSESVECPVVAHGGARSVADLRQAVRAGASAVAAGTLFVLYGPMRAVLVSYPDRETRAKLAP
jgi:cyclase